VTNETQVSSVSDQVQTGYDLAADFALRSFPIFDQFTTVKTADTNPGSSITFHRWTELAEQISPLNEITDVTPVELGSSVLTVTPVEQGMTTVTTAKVRADTMLPSFSADQVNLVAYNMATSLDSICRVVMEASGNNTFVGQETEGAITTTDILTADAIRTEHAVLQAANVMPFGADYVWILHPHVAYDLKSETGDGAWVAPAQYVNTDKIYNNEIGKFAGFKFLESTRCDINLTGGNGGTVDTYTSIVLGAENTAKAISTAPGLVQGPIIDYLNRLVPLGWYGYLGWDTFRAAASSNVISASSLGGA